MKQRIQVTEDDIKDTVQGDPHACMVWRAVTRNLQLETQTGAEPVEVYVQYDKVIFSRGDGIGGGVVVPLSTYVNGKIRKFDKDRNLVQPFAFDLNLPDDWREQVMKGSAK